MGGWYLELPVDAHEALDLEPNCRVLLHAGTLTMHRALRQSRNGYSYIGLNGESVRKLNLLEGSELEVSLEPDTSDFGMDFPEEIREVLAQDPEGEELFLAMTPGKRRGLLHYVASAKSSETRINRSLHMMKRLREMRDAGEI